jgi:alkylation response protein AidB-like acyl-CoA dehydrogenase
MNLLYSDTEEDLRASVRSLCAARCSTESLLARVESDQRYDLDLWRTLAADVGVVGLAVPEAHGGQGGSARELAVVAEELGRAVAPVPFLGGGVLGATALAACGAPPTDGTVLAVSATTAPEGSLAPEVTVSADGRAHGAVRAVMDGAFASTFVVPAAGPHGLALYTVDGARVRPIVPLDLTRPLADVTFDGTAAPLATGADAETALRATLRMGTAMLAAEQLGVAQWCLDTVVAYLKQRYQFARQVGSFQSLKHRMADVWLDLVTARAASRNAADCLATDSPDTATAVAVAAQQCSTVAVHAAEECVQLHGGIGMTWEHPVHLYLKRAKSSELILGAPSAHLSALAALVDLPA